MCEHVLELHFYLPVVFFVVFFNIFLCLAFLRFALCVIYMIYICDIYIWPRTTWWFRKCWPPWSQNSVCNCSWSSAYVESHLQIENNFFSIDLHSSNLCCSRVTCISVYLTVNQHFTLQVRCRNLSFTSLFPPLVS